MRLGATVTLALLLVLASAWVWHSPWSYAAQDRQATSEGISARHVAGTDELGRDRSVRIAAALLLGTTGAVLASALAAILAVALGAAAGFGPRWCGRLLLFGGDVFLTLPWLFLLMMVRSALPLTMPAAHSAILTFFLLAVLGAPAYIRMHQARTAALRRADWLLQARAGGLRPTQIPRQLLPHLRPLFLTQFLLYIPAALAAEANLGTLGLGISEPLPSWGSMLQSLQNAALLNTSYLTYLPLITLVLVLTLFEFLVTKEQEAAR